MSFFKRFLLIFSAILFCQEGFSQFNKAEELYNRNFIEQSIPYLKKSLNTKHHDAALEKLAHAYFILRQYSLAEEYYQQIVEKGNPKPEQVYNYAECLMANQKYKEAQNQFKKYTKLNPSDNKGQIMAKACAEIEKIKNEQPKFAINQIEGINTEHCELSPIILTKEKIVFCSDRPFKNNYVSPSANKGDKQLHLYQAQKNNNQTSFYQLQDFAPILNKGYYNGPLSIAQQKKLIAFNKIDAPSPFIKKEEKAKIFFAFSNNFKNWENYGSFPYNSNQYSLIHPCLSADGQILVFASDMPGGFGGFDLYVSYYKNREWTKPENLGALINSPFNELFPYLSSSNTLFFSSDGGAVNYGGLDIFKSEYNTNKWQEPENLLSPLNSSYDDFGIVWDEEEQQGYFSSNRPGGKGKDDIYQFKALQPKLLIAGKILLSENLNDPAKGVKLLLLTESGTVVQTVTTDKNGSFKFFNLPDEKSFMLKLDDSDTTIAPYKKIYLADANNVIRKKTSSDQNGIFTFYNLPLKEDKNTQEIEDDTRISITGSILAGENPSKPLSEKNIILTDDKGNFVASSKTDQFGSFKFAHLPPEKNYIIKLDETDNSLPPNTRIIITNNKGKTVQTFFSDKSGKFIFEILKSESNSLRVLEEEDTSLRIEFKGKLYSDNNYSTPLANTSIYLTDKRGKVLQSTKTDTFGAFKFENLPSDNNYLIVVEETDVGAAIKQIFVTDDKGQLIRKFIFEKGKFNFEILPEDKQYLSSIYVEDPWLKMKDIKENKTDSITVIENIYYEYGKWNITPEGAKILDKVAQIMKENTEIFIELYSHTDSRSSAKFNLELSQKRAKSAIDYIIQKGIPSYRIKGEGKGESELVNYCSDGVECSEEQHAQNRRTEFKVVKKKN